ncbi:hypothetical protein CRG98_022025 [Punica granatum]|uniref:RBR-type E3 ubiquitin transferase n=1 Tax=Punica granatum TaxID=22663 RepID=A0A2I0JMN8_PUNGR|nr:hypothetical protein CRG98_022025 [Punica granatum]
MAMMNNPPSIFNCVICMHTNLPSDYRIPFAAIGCYGHNQLCRKCTAKHIKASIAQGKAHVKCPLLHCSWTFHPIACQELVTREVFDKWCNLLCESAVRGYERCYCPNKDCRELIVDECEPSACRKIRCPRCKNSCCFKCANPWEEGHDHWHDEVHIFIEKKNWMRCPGCKNFVERIEGFSQILCRCQTKFCYRCGTKLLFAFVYVIESCRRYTNLAQT